MVKWRIYWTNTSGRDDSFTVELGDLIAKLQEMEKFHHLISKIEKVYDDI